MVFPEGKFQTADSAGFRAPAVSFELPYRPLILRLWRSKALKFSPLSSIQMHLLIWFGSLYTERSAHYNIRPVGAFPKSRAEIRSMDSRVSARQHRGAERGYR